MMRWIKRIVLGIGALVLVAVAGVAAFVLTFDPADYKQEIAAALESATGRKVQFNGKIEADILTLQPAITVHDAALPNPPGFSRPQFATAKRLHFTLRLRSLLDRRIDIIRLEIVGGDVLFETNEKGERNWRHKAEAAAPAAPGAKIGEGRAIAGLRIDQFRLKRSRIAYLHGATKLDSAIYFEQVRVAFADADKPMKIRLEGNYQGTKIRAEGTVGTLNELLQLRAGTVFPLALRVAFGRSELAVDLKADLTAGIPTARGRVSAKHIDLDELSPPAARGTGTGDGRMFSAAPLPLGILSAFNVEGEVGIESLILGRQRFSGLTAKLALKGGDLTANAFAFTLAGARITGDLRVNASSAVPAVSLRANGSGVRLREVTPMVSSSMVFAVNVTARGRSMREIAQALTGPVTVAVGPGPINAGTLDFLSKDIFSIHRTDPLALICGIARFDFARGIGRAQRIVIDTTRATAYGGGSVNLHSETLDILFAPTTKGTSFASVAALVPVRVQGPIARPSASPELSRAPQEVAKSLFGVVEAPAELVGSLFGRANASSTRSAGCGGAASAGPAAPGPRGPQKEEPSLIQRGGETLRRLNPF